MGVPQWAAEICSHLIGIGVVSFLVTLVAMFPYCWFLMYRTIRETIEADKRAKENK